LKHIYLKFTYQKEVTPSLLKLFKKIEKTIREKIGNVKRAYLFFQEMGYKLERSYGICSFPLRSIGVYRRGYNFYSSSAETKSRLTLICANTSGLFNPLERLGTEVYQVDRCK